MFKKTFNALLNDVILNIVSHRSMYYLDCSVFLMKYLKPHLQLHYGINMLGIYAHSEEHLHRIPITLKRKLLYCFIASKIIQEMLSPAISKKNVSNPEAP